MKAPYSIFGKTKLVNVVVYLNGEQIESSDWDEEYWVERGEDWYGLSSTNLKNKKVRVVTRESWLRS